MHLFSWAIQNVDIEESLPIKLHEIHVLQRCWEQLEPWDTGLTSKMIFSSIFLFSYTTKHISSVCEKHACINSHKSNWLLLSPYLFQKAVKNFCYKCYNLGQISQSKVPVLQNILCYFYFTLNGYLSYSI